MSTEVASVKINSDSAIKSDTDKTLLVLSAPSMETNHYSSDLNAILDYMINFANIASGKDEVAILADAATLPYFEGKVPSTILIKANIKSIWARDFAPVIPTKQVKFKFLPSYHPAEHMEAVDNSFKDWFSKSDLHYDKTSDIILDGGNVVDNAAGTMIIVTDRILRDNPSLTKVSVTESLKQLLGVNQVAIIRELPDDTTGHADGMIMWATNDRILLHTVDEPVRTQNLNELKSSFPGVEIVEVPDYYERRMYRDFASAHNVYVNSLVTDNYMYMPTFNNVHDAEMLSLFQSYTDKMVVPVPAENVCKWGGSVRCLSWQVKGGNRMKILQLAEQ